MRPFIYLSLKDFKFQRSFNESRFLTPTSLLLFWIKVGKISTVPRPRTSSGCLLSGVCRGLSTGTWPLLWLRRRQSRKGKRGVRSELLWVVTPSLLRTLRTGIDSRGPPRRWQSEGVENEMSLLGDSDVGLGLQNLLRSSPLRLHSSNFDLGVSPMDRHCGPSTICPSKVQREGLEDSVQQTFLVPPESAPID